MPNSQASHRRLLCEIRLQSTKDLTCGSVIQRTALFSRKKKKRGGGGLNAGCSLSEPMQAFLGVETQSRPQVSILDTTAVGQATQSSPSILLNHFAFNSPLKVGAGMSCPQVWRKSVSPNQLPRPPLVRRFCKRYTCVANLHGRSRGMRLFQAVEFVRA